ncbi:MAG TPA: phage tail protein [Allosphingosinicella sp.]|jgi:phage tail-like protein
MDVNGLPMWQLAGRADFGLAEHSAAPNIADNLHFKDEKGHVRLARQQPAPALAEDENFARLMVSSPSPIADDLGGFAWWNASEKRLEASGFAPGGVELPLPRDDPPSPVAPTDFALGADDVIYIARDGSVAMKDLHERWRPAQAKKQGFIAALLAPAPDGGVWAFDRTNRRLARLKGYPLRFAGLRDADPNRFEPVEPNPNPPRLLPVARARIAPRYDAVAMAASAGGRLALLAWEDGADAAVFTLEEVGFVLRFRLAGLRFPYSLAWIGEEEIAVLAGDGGKPSAQAFVYPMDLPPLPSTPLPPEGEVHPLIEARAGKFCNSAAPVPLYLTADGPAAAPSGIRPLRGLSGGNYARSGSVMIGPIDSGQTACVWHRLYLEAAVPSRGAILIEAVAREDDSAPPAPGQKNAPAWVEHRVAAIRDPDLGRDVPHASWCAEPSEIPFSPPMLDCPSRPGQSGLFTLLLQRAGRKVRRISGRYLWLRITLEGDSQCSPELAAIRVYAKRFSYRDRYLPAFYREALTAADADVPGDATPHDFMDRLLGLYEGVLTEIEGKIASSWLLTDPAAAPDSALPWIGQWIGVEAAASDSPAPLRQALRAAPHTAALNGTLGGLMAALEIATGGLFVTGGRLDPGRAAPAPGSLAVARLGDVALRALMLGMQAGGECAMLAGGAVTRGDIVVVEGFRLRRTFATILGADLADEQDPLTLGMASSGNSFVGDTLILGDEARSELLALYRGEIDGSAREAEAVAQFYARLAHRVLVLVRGVSDPAGLRRLRDVVEAQIPAHVEPRIHQARDPLIVGAASLVGIDTYLAEARPFEQVRLGSTILGQGDFVAGSGHLDPRADGPVSARPTARADGPAELWSGSNFTLSAMRSSAPRGRRISRHIWTWE